MKYNIDLKRFRSLVSAHRGTKMTQTDFAKLLGLSTRGYQKLEHDSSKVTQLHVYALCWALYRHSPIGADRLSLLINLCDKDNTHDSILSI